MKEMNFTECTESRGNTRLLEHKSKVINLSCSPSKLSQCQQGSCRKCTQPSPAWGMQCQSLSRQEKLLSWLSQGNTSCSLPPPAPPWALISIPALWDCPMEAPFKLPEQQGMGPAVSHTQLLLPSLLPQIRNPLGFQHMLNPLFPPGRLSFFHNFFSFLQKIQVLHTQSQLDKSQSCSFSCNFGVLFSACSPQILDLTQRKGGTGYVMALGVLKLHHSTVKSVPNLFFTQYKCQHSAVMTPENSRLPPPCAPPQAIPGSQTGLGWKKPIFHSNSLKTHLIPAPQHRQGCHLTLVLSSGSPEIQRRFQLCFFSKRQWENKEDMFSQAPQLDRLAPVWSNPICFSWTQNHSN